MGLISRVSSRTYRLYILSIGRGYYPIMPQILDEDAMSPCMGEEQMSLNCRSMYSVIENYRNCKKFWTKFVRTNGTRFAPKFEDREQIINYMKKTGASPYEYVEPSDVSANVPVDVNIGRDMERIKKEEEFEQRFQQKLKEKFEQTNKTDAHKS